MSTPASLSAGALRKLTRRIYEQTALVAVRKAQQIILFWARRCRKSTTLEAIAYDELSRERGRTVIAASSSLLLGTDLVGVTLSASEHAAMVLSEASALRSGFLMGAALRGRGTNVQCANRETGRVYGKLPESFSVNSGLFRAIPGSAEIFCSRGKNLGHPLGLENGWDVPPLGWLALRRALGLEPAETAPALWSDARPVPPTAIREKGLNDPK
jgi:hypothetical protein